MPLLKRKQVALVPLPTGLEDGSVPPDTEVFQLKATGEIFLDYESYAERMKFYLEKIFSCEFTGKSGMDYFQALESEKRESDKTQKAFPEQLKSRVLRACQFQVEGRLEGMVDLVFERFEKRYFLHERILVDDPIPGAPFRQQYGALIRRVVPPVQRIREQLEQSQSSNPAVSSLANLPENILMEISQPNGTFGQMTVDNVRIGELELTPEQLDPLCHTIGCRLELPKEEADTLDDPKDYTYIVQLMQENHFLGSIVEVKADKLQRDRVSWNKALVRKYLKESIYRDSAVGSPWQVKQKYVEMYNVPTQLPAEQLARSKELREDLLNKRKKPRADKGGVLELEDGTQLAPPKVNGRKRQYHQIQTIQTEGGPAVDMYGQPYPSNLSPGPYASAYPYPMQEYSGAGSSASPSGVHGHPAPGLTPYGSSSTLHPSTAKATPPPPRMKAIKYPIEDLELDPTTIFDGRILNRKHMALPDLPKKPLVNRTLPVPAEHFERFMNCWNFLNIFGLSLQISPFTLDDFTNALQHDAADPRCILLGEIHSVLTNLIAAEGFTVAGTTKASVDSIPHLAATTVNEDGMSVKQRRRWVTAALQYSRGWDKRARPRASDGRKGWDVHLLGILTQKGGLETMPTLPTIFKHLFTDDDYVEEEEELTKEEDEEVVEEDQELKVETAEEGKVESEMEAKPETVTDGEVRTKVEAAAADDVPMEGQAETADTVSKAGDENSVEKVEEEASGLKKEEADATAAPEAEKEEVIMHVDASAAATPGKKNPKAQYYGTPNPDPEKRYPSLSLTQKLDILSFLCDMNLGSKAVKKYMDECELRLTEERKTRADFNRERKTLLAERTLLLQAAKAANAPPSAPAGDGSPAVGKTANGEAASTTVTPLVTPAAGNDMEDITSTSIAPSERDESVMGEAIPASREPSSSPISDLDMEDDSKIEVDELNDDEPAPSMKDVDETMEVDSQVDELESSSSDEAKKQEEEEKKKKSPKAPAAKRRKSKPVDRKTEIEEELEMNTKKEDLFERDFRRHKEVHRIAPLGKDRFYQRYWWFDGVGPQSLIAPNGRIIYGTGRLFVQGPSESDWQKACDEFGGEQAMLERRRKEEGHDPWLEVDGWGYYEEEQDIEQLLAWLNQKGIRELACRNNIIKWKHYIVEGAKSRQSDLLHGFEGDVTGSRVTRLKGKAAFEQSPTTHYLAYENNLAQK